MSNNNKTPSAPVSSADIQDRGRALQHAFRIAGVPQYTRWYLEVEPKWKGDSSRMYRIRRLFNGEGTKDDLSLLEMCEVLARRHLKQAA